eukprot:4167711-Alexandrium_andersonii.AAC.1
MSASLVGSEMCIRDRGNPAKVRGKRAESSSALNALHPSSEQPICAFAPSVSYTHLTLPTICSV